MTTAERRDLEAKRAELVEGLAAAHPSRRASRWYTDRVEELARIERRLAA